MTALKKAIETSQAPAAIGTYSQAIRVNDMVFISGQVPINPETGQVHEGTTKQQLYMMFDNLKAICEAAGGSMNDIVKTTVFITDFANFSLLNSVMAEYFSEPYPARSTVGVASLPRNVPFEIEAIMTLHQTVGR
ncbi:MAG: RidA family protein [Gammaproteobacteria bacterium]